MKQNNKSRKGFTIVELVIVIAVIAILAGVLIPTFSNVVDKANDSSALQEARNVYTNYMAEFNYSTGETPAEDLVIKANGKYFAVTDGKLSDTVYTTLDSAKTAADNAAEVVCDECVDAQASAADGTTGKGVCDDCGENMPANPS